MLSISGEPYDTLKEVIGITENKSSLASFNINYEEIDLLDDDFDYEKIENALKNIARKPPMPNGDIPKKPPMINEDISKKPPMINGDILKIDKIGFPPRKANKSKTGLNVFIN